MPVSTRLFSVAEEQAIIARYQQGETGAAIARMLACRREPVYLVLREAGVLRRQAPERRQSLCQCDRCGREDVYTLPRGEFEATCLYCGGVAWSEALTDRFATQRLGELIARLEAELDDD